MKRVLWRSIKIGVVVTVLVLTVGCVRSTQLQVGSTPLTVEIAQTQVEQQRGLSGRINLAPNAGMLFIFSAPGQYRFWMKDMAFPLDFLWLRSGTIIEITSNVPVPTSSVPLFYQPSQPIDMVIEVNSGWAAQHAIMPGQTIQGLP